MTWPLEQNPFVGQGMCSLSLMYRKSIVSYLVDLDITAILSQHISTIQQ